MILILLLILLLFSLSLSLSLLLSLLFLSLSRVETSTKSIQYIYKLLISHYIDLSIRSNHDPHTTTPHPSSLLPFQNQSLFFTQERRRRFTFGLCRSIRFRFSTSQISNLERNVDGVFGYVLSHEREKIIIFFLFHHSTIQYSLLHSTTSFFTSS